MARNYTPKRLIHVTGLDTVSEILRAIPADLRTQVTAEAVTAAAKPVEIAAKRYAKRSERTGALREAIGTVVRRYPDKGTAVAIVGVRRGYYKGRRRIDLRTEKKGNAESPSHYAHLVEFGHHMVTGGSTRGQYQLALVGTGRFSAKSGKEIKRWKRGALIAPGTGAVKRWVAAKPFLRPAWLTTKEAVTRELMRGLERGIKRTRRRLVKAGQHAA
jgi:hypothetical protein